MTAPENGRPAEGVYFAFRNQRLELAEADDDHVSDEFRALREKVRQLNQPIEIEAKEEAE
jgi:hypothetical protein